MAGAVASGSLDLRAQAEVRSALKSDPLVALANVTGEEWQICNPC